MRSKRHFLLSLILILFSIVVKSQRPSEFLHNDWEFAKMDAIQPVWKEVVLPHTYNTLDAFDDEPGYYRGPASYRKVLTTSHWNRLQNHYIRFDGVNQEAEVVLNGHIVGKHLGGYTAFTLDLTPWITYSSDTIEVRVNNRHNEDIPPLMGDFTFYGGIYRSVSVIHLEPTHIRPDFYSSDGVFFTTNEIDGNRIRFKCEVHLRDFDDNTHSIFLSKTDSTVSTINLLSSNYDIKSQIWIGEFEIDNATPWSIKNPQLYDFTVGIEDSEEQIIDEILITTGFRMIQVDLEKGFQLNGESFKLIGVNRHQDRPGIGNALSAGHHQDDMKWIHSMGANFLRTAHYPQDHLILSTCDDLGIVVSMEIPLDHRMKDTDAFKHNSKEMLREMVYQYYNHPSISIWAYMNEMGLSKRIDRDAQEMEAVADFGQELEEIIQSLDPIRYSMLPNHGDANIYDHFHITDIPDIIGWNLYYGWYEPDFAGFGSFTDNSYAKNPTKPVIISEYGAGADPRITSFEPVRFDFSLNWSLQFHQAHINAIKERSYIIGSAVWNMFDFGSEQRIDAVPHINNKGLMSFGRKPKPTYYLYQAHLTDKKVIHLGALPTSILIDKSRHIPIEIIGNTSDNELLINNVPYKFNLNNRLDIVDINVVPGDNSIYIKDKLLHNLTAYSLESYWEHHRILRINLGTNFYFSPDDGTNIWYPSEEVPSSFMLVSGGARFQPRDAGIGSNRAISHTVDDPVYQTRLEHPKEIRCKVPSGRYRIILHLAKLNDLDCSTIFIQGNSVSTTIKKQFSAYQFEHEIYADGEIFIEFKEPESYINGIEIIRL